MARDKSGRSINILISALVVIALVPAAILFVQLWQDMMQPHSVTLPVTALPTVALHQPGLDYPKDNSRFEVADNDDEDIAPPGQFAASDGGPGSAGGWSFASEATGALPESVPAQGNTATFPARLTVPSMAPSPTAIETADASDRPSPEPSDRAEHRPAAVPLPQRNPASSAGTAPTVRTVKVVTIAPPQPARPHDGAYALGSAADEAQAPAEWMETKTAVDMHAKAEQSSETVKVAEGGIKMRVTARDKNWVKVTDPKTSTSGWIYNRFLQPTEPPAP
jgi:hypothetical protein